MMMMINSKICCYWQQQKRQLAVTVKAVTGWLAVTGTVVTSKLAGGWLLAGWQGLVWQSKLLGCTTAGYGLRRCWRVQVRGDDGQAMMMAQGQVMGRRWSDGQKTTFQARRRP